jgi:hypothetical protein
MTRLNDAYLEIPTNWIGRSLMLEKDSGGMVVFEAPKFELILKIFDFSGDCEKSLVDDIYESNASAKVSGGRVSILTVRQGKELFSSILADKVLCNVIVEYWIWSQEYRLSGKDMRLDQNPKQYLYLTKIDPRLENIFEQFELNRYVFVSILLKNILFNQVVFQTALIEILRKFGSVKIQTVGPKAIY